MGQSSTGAGTHSPALKSHRRSGTGSSRHPPRNTPIATTTPLKVSRTVQSQNTANPQPKTISRLPPPGVVA